jgi:hypothetical protein
MKRNTSRFSSTFLTLNGSTSTRMNIQKSMTLTIISCSIITDPGAFAPDDYYFSADLKNDDPG